MADKYMLRVTAGPGYETADHQVVPVNHHQPIRISSEHADIELNVRVQDYRGLPHGSPSTSPYFEQEPHKYNGDQYSISMRLTPKKPAGGAATKPESVPGHGDGTAGGEGDGEGSGISGLDLQWGNDFDRPIRERLPPGFSTAFGIVKWWIDPGLDGDAYADRPYLYGPALSSFNALHLGAAPDVEDKGGIWVEEGGDAELRQSLGMPPDSKGRMKWALNDNAKRGWVWEYGQTYSLDFYNPYLDFSNLALRLPGFHLPIMKYWDGQGLRYVLKNRKTGDCYLAVCFTLHLKEDVNEDGTVREEVPTTGPQGDDAAESGAPSSQKNDESKTETSADDLD